jgi:sugar phosphate isomerase/epimerase
MAGLAGARYAWGDPDPTSGPSSNPVPPIQDRICVFTDHVDDAGFTYQEVAKLLAELKVAGPDLTVRGGGLVPPEAVAEELPKAAAAFRDQGMSIPMISTSIQDAKDPVSLATLQTMSRLGIGYYKLGYYHYHDVGRWEAELKQTQASLAGLVEVGKRLGVVAGIHNHAGPTVGGVLWDLVEVLKPLDPAWVGSYFDPAHATVEGGNYGWKFNFTRLAPRLKMIAVKDFLWEKSNGEWRVRWCPLGEGQVRWSEFFALLKEVAFAGPISLHIEYPTGGDTRVSRFDNALAATERDLRFLREKLDEAFGRGC